MIAPVRLTRQWPRGSSYYPIENSRPAAVGVQDHFKRETNTISALRTLRDVEKTGLSQAMRAKRWRMFAERFPELNEMTVLDLGGTERSWDACPLPPAKLTLVNMPGLRGIDMSENVLAGDACDPDLLAGESYDLVFSNSVIEHVGGHYRQQQFAENVRRLGTHHWIQTPYRFFPVEPHFLMPFIQWLPQAARVKLACHWPLGNVTARRDHPEIMTKIVLEIELLSITAMRNAFPDSQLVYERVGGLVKSLIAVR